MKAVLHLMAGGETGGIEILCRDYASYSKHNNIFVILWSPGVISDEMKNRGDTIIELDAYEKNHIKVIKELGKIIEQNQVNVFIVHHASPILHFYMMIVKYKYRSLITIAYAHSLAEVMYRRDEKKRAFLRKKVLQCSLKKADYIVAVSNAVRDSLVEAYKIPLNDIEVIYNGVDTGRFVARHIQNLKNSLKMIYVGRLIESKGVQTILRAMAMYESEAEIHLTVVGDGAYRQALQKLARDLGIEQKVEFLGNRNDVPELLTATDIFLHVPLLEEGFGITVIEAMACGLVCICSKSGALPEIIDNRCNGFLVDKGDAAGIYECLKSIMEFSQADLCSIKREAVKKAGDFSIDKFVDKLDALIESGSCDKYEI